MAVFRISVGGKTGTGTTNGDSKGNFTSEAKCLFCSTKFTAKKKAGQSRSIGEMESAVRFMLIKHYNKKHKEK